MEKLKPPWLLEGMQNDTATQDKSSDISEDMEHRLPHDPATLTLRDIKTMYGWRVTKSGHEVSSGAMGFEGLTVMVAASLIVLLKTTSVSG